MEVIFMWNFIIVVDHTASGVVDKLDESNCTREISSLVVSYLEQLGNYAKLLRIDKSNIYKYQDCYERAEEDNDIAESVVKNLHKKIKYNR